MNLQTLKEIANEHITLIFDAFGLEYRDNGNGWCMTCPIHGGDNPTAFSWHSDRGYFRCFTRKCERDGADIFDFVQKYKKCTLKQARDMVSSIVVTEGYKYIPEQELVAEAAFRRYIRNNLKPAKNFEMLDPDFVKELEPDTYLHGRGFSEEVLDEYSIGYCGDRNSLYATRTCIPIYHHDGSLVGITARATDEDFAARGDAKWLHTPGLPKAQMLFNLFKATKTIQKTHKAIIVEGPLDVLKFWMAGIYNVVAVLGSDLSGPQRSLLLERECFDMVLAFDNDTSGEDSTKKIIKTCKPYFNLCQMILPNGKDIGDLSVETIHNLDIIKV